ncbi:MAG: hypothetical protein KDK70_32480, partial [Myxococcales bacterium]|nr:hypothetical protein [Myxococcales bacterium]
DAQACSDAFDALPLGSDFLIWGSDVPSYRSLALTRGDEASAIGTRAGLLDLLGPIDAPGDAALLATLDGHQLVCRAGNDVGESGDDYVVHTRSGGGCGEGDDIEEHVVLVHADGTVEVIQTVLIEKGDPNCAIGRLPAGLCRSRCGSPTPCSSTSRPTAPCPTRCCCWWAATSCPARSSAC